jgi:hypothetical protein
MADTKSKRQQQIEARVNRVSSLIPKMPTVRVMPRDEAIRKGIAHPEGNLKFPDSGSVEWPLDQFTQRRLRDGTVTLVRGEPTSYTDKATGIVQTVATPASEAPPAHTRVAPPPAGTSGHHEYRRERSAPAATMPETPPVRRRSTESPSST